MKRLATQGLNLVIVSAGYWAIEANTITVTFVGYPS